MEGEAMLGTRLHHCRASDSTCTSKVRQQKYYWWDVVKGNCLYASNLDKM